MKLSEHFQNSEFACPCCGLAAVVPALVVALEELRAKLGNKPIRVTSGFRCAGHNAAVGGAKSSQHLTGRAVDIAVAGLTGMEIYEAARTIPAFRGFGVAGGWCHLDLRQLGHVRWRYDGHGRQYSWPMEATHAAD
jgi:uncharacterized protein YcbK (DUF882 family)